MLMVLGHASAGETPPPPQPPNIHPSFTRIDSFNPHDGLVRKRAERTQSQDTRSPDALWGSRTRTLALGTTLTHHSPSGPSAEKPNAFPGAHLNDTVLCFPSLLYVRELVIPWWKGVAMGSPWTLPSSPLVSPTSRRWGTLHLCSQALILNCPNASTFHRILGRLPSNLPSYCRFSRRC